MPSRLASVIEEEIVWINEKLAFQLVWYILKQLFTLVSVKVVDIYLAALRISKYPPPFTSTSVD